jgi:uncharacterized repeat protein (TIGR01451 family)
VTLVATVTATTPGTKPNFGEVTSTTLDPVLGNEVSPVTVDVAPTADVSITKTASPDPLDSTGPATFTLAVHNAGPQSAAGVQVTDPLPAGFTFTSATPSQGSCNAVGADNILRCNLGTIASGADATIAVGGTLAPSTAGTILSNSALVDSITGDPAPSNNSTRFESVVIPAADLELTKVADNAAPGAGGTVVFTLQLTNHGPSVAVNAQVTDTLPASLTLLSAPDCAVSGSTVTCAAGSLASGASRSFPITARVDAPGDVTNIATATSETPDPIAANNTDATTVSAGAVTPPPPPPSPPESSADLVVSKRALGAALVGRSLRYEVKVENRGPSTASAVALTDALPGQLELVAATATQGSCSGTQAVTCALGDIASGASATVTLTATPQRTGSVTNTATVTSSTPDPDPGSNVAAATVRARFAPTRVSVRKRADRASVAAAGAVNYRITVRNTGSAGARDLRVCDKLGAGLAFVSAPGARMRNGQACWTVKRLPRGKSRTFRVTARATSTTSARRVTNRVRVSGANVAARAAQARVRVLPAQSAGGGVTG